MDIDALRTLTLVEHHGSFAAAARVIDADPSAVSRIIANIEKELGIRLFQRTTRSLTVTEEGEIYLRRIRPLLEEMESAREEASGTRLAPTGTLKMTASVAFSYVCIVPHLADFHARFPDITLELMPTDANLELTANGIDLAVRLAPVPSGDLISTRLMQTKYMVCASPEYLSSNQPIIEPGDLANHNCLRFALPQYRTRWRFRQKDEKPFDVSISGHTVIANALSLRSAALDGLGPVLLADWLISDDLKEGRLVQLFSEFECTATEFDTGAWALYPSRNYLPQKVRIMIDFLREKLSQRN